MINKQPHYIHYSVINLEWVCVYSLQALQVKQLSWYKLPMAWHAWLAPWTALLHFTQLPANKKENNQVNNFITIST